MALTEGRGVNRKPPSKRWLGVLAGIVLACALCAAALFAATWLLTGGTAALVTPYDLLARPGEPALLRVKLQRGVGLRDAEDEMVEFRIPGGGSCGDDSARAQHLGLRFVSPARRGLAPIRFT